MESKSYNQKTLLIVGGALVIAAFLLGFVPEYLKARHLEGQVELARREADLARERSQTEELGLLDGYVYLETNLKNYGTASQYSTKFFDRVRNMANQAPDTKQQTYLQSALTKRDVVTAGLAKGDPGTAAAVQDLFQSALKTTQAEWK